MVSGINKIEQIAFQPQFSPKYTSTTASSGSLNNFDVEDKAMISSQAKLLNELEKFNSGQGDPVDLAVAGVTAKNTVSAEVNVIQAKKDMIDSILDIGK